MFRLLKIYLTITLNFTAIFALSYDTFILLEFENVSQSKTSDYLRHMLPDVIKDHNLDSHIKIEYAGEIEPYLGIDNEKYKNALIVLGQFSSKDFSIYVNIDVRDASSWKKINKFNFSCAYQDDLCFEKNMIDYSLTILNNLSLDSKNIEVLSENKIISENIDSVNSFYKSLGNFAIEADLNNTWDKLYNEGNQYGKRYYKDIDKGFYQNIVKNSKEKNTE